MSEPAPVLIEATRGGFAEARHRGSLVLLAADGRVDASAGDVTAPVLARSSLKPLQAVALLEAGFAGPPDWVALACASHEGEPVHVAGVRAMLRGAGLTEPELQCPPALPLAEPALIDWVAADGRAARVCHNCSGKHAAMLTAARAARWPLATYRDPAHPLQIAIRDRLGELAGEAVSGVEIDGCGAPAFALSPVGLARAFAAVATASSGATAEVAAAMRAHPELVSGTYGPHVELSRGVAGLVAKDGAEGMLAAALPDGRALAVKFADGSGRGRPPLLAAVLRYWGFDGPAIDRWAAVPTLGGGEPVGEIRPSCELLALLTPP